MKVGYKMDKNKRDTLIIGLLAMNLLAMTFYSNRAINKVDRLEQEIKHTKFDLADQLEYSKSELVKEIMASIDDSSSLISQLDYKLDAYDADTKKAVYKVELKLKEQLINSQVKWTYEGLEHKDESYLNPIDALTYEGEVAMPITDDYKINVIQVSANGEKILNTQPFQLNLKSDYIDQRIYLESSSGSSSIKSFAQETSFEMNILDDASYGIQKVELLMTNDEKILHTRDITNDILIGNDLSTLKKALYTSDYYKENSSEQGMNYSEGTAIAIKENTREIDKTYLLHYISGDFKDYDGLKPDYMRLEYRFTFNDGYVYTSM